MPPDVAEVAKVATRAGATRVVDTVGEESQTNTQAQTSPHLAPPRPISPHLP